MKKRYIPLLMVLIFLLSIPANAQTERTATRYAQLTFNGTVARCDVDISTSNLKGNISAIIELRDGNSCINSWAVSGTGIIHFSDSTTTVVKGRSYELTVEYTIDGKPQTSLTSSGICR